MRLFTALRRLVPRRARAHNRGRHRPAHHPPLANLRHSTAPAADLLEAHTALSVQRGIPRDYYERFEGAFIGEAREFVEAVLEGRDVPVDLRSSFEAVRIGVALQESLREGKTV